MTNLNQLIERREKEFDERFIYKTIPKGVATTCQKEIPTLHNLKAFDRETAELAYSLGKKEGVEEERNRIFSAIEDYFLSSYPIPDAKVMCGYIREALKESDKK